MARPRLPGLPVRTIHISYLQIREHGGIREKWRGGVVSDRIGVCSIGHSMADFGSFHRTERSVSGL